MKNVRGRFGLVIGLAAVGLTAMTLAGCKTTQCTGEDCDTCTGDEACCADGTCTECAAKKAAEEQQ